MRGAFDSIYVEKKTAFPGIVLHGNMSLEKKKLLRKMHCGIVLHRNITLGKLKLTEWVVFDSTEKGKLG